MEEKPEVPCFSCPSSSFCCSYPDPKEGFVSLGLNEAKKIREHTGKQIEEFAEFRAVDPELLEDFKQNDPEIYETLIDGKVLALKLKKNGDCIFLGKNKLCTIYSARPLICRLYPFWYERDEKGEMVITKMDDSTDENGGNCPATRDSEEMTPKHFDKFLMQKEYLLKLAAESEKEEKLYMKYAPDIAKGMSFSEVLKKLEHGDYSTKSE